MYRPRIDRITWFSAQGVWPRVSVTRGVWPRVSVTRGVWLERGVCDQRGCVTRVCVSDQRGVTRGVTWAGGVCDGCVTRGCDKGGVTGGVWLGGGWPGKVVTDLPDHTPSDPPLPNCERITDACENITFARFATRAVTSLTHVLAYLLSYFVKPRFHWAVNLLVISEKLFTCQNQANLNSIFLNNHLHFTTRSLCTLFWRRKRRTYFTINL